MLRVKRTATVIALAAVTATTAACGGNDTSQAGAGSGGSPEQSADLERARAAVAVAEREPTEIPLKTPLKGRAKSGGTVYWMNCEVLGCRLIGSGLEEAAQAAGWKFRKIDYKLSEPSSLTIAFRDALREKPDAVAFSGAPEPLWEQIKPTFEKAGVSMIPLFVGPARVDGPVIGNIAGEIDNVSVARKLADWFILNSKGSGKALVQGIPGFPAVSLWKDEFERHVKANCPDCQTEGVDTSIADVTSGAANTNLISALQRNPDLKYVVTYNGVFIPGFQAQLQAAGRSDVKLAGYTGTSDYVTATTKGSDYAFLGNNHSYAGWLAMDMALRKAEGSPIVAEESTLPTQLLTRRSATPEIAKAVDDYPRPRDFREQMRRLWSVR